MLRLVEINKYYGDNCVLKNISLEVHKGEVVSIIGKSGSGKSTVLRCINMLENPDSGEVFVNGVNIKTCDLAKIRQRIGMVFQNYNLFDHLTILENLIIAPIKLLKLNKNIALEKARSLLKTVGLENKENAMPSELSGGQRQRVAIARAIIMDPDLVLFDEPTSSLDPLMTNEVLGIIYKLSKTGMTMVIVTHEMRFAKLVSDKVVYIENGTIIETGTANQIFDHPLDIRTQRFVDFELGLEWN